MAREKITDEAKEALVERKKAADVRVSDLTAELALRVNAKKAEDEADALEKALEKLESGNGEGG